MDDVDGAANTETGIGGADGPGCGAEEEELAWDTGANPGCTEGRCATGDGDRLRQDGESASWIGSSSSIEELRRRGGVSLRGRGDGDDDDESCSGGMRLRRGPLREVRHAPDDDAAAPPWERAPRGGGSSSSIGSCTVGSTGSGRKLPNMDEIVRPPPEGRAEDAAMLPIPPGAAALLDDSEKPCLAAGVGDGLRDGGGEESSISSIGDGGASAGRVAFRLRLAFPPSVGFGSLPSCI